LVRVGELVIQNPWWKHGEGFVQFDRHLQIIKDNIFCRKEIELKKGNIYILLGSRQVGKTTYLKLCVKELIRNGVNPDNILYVSCDFFISRKELRNALTYFINKNLDEKEFFIFIDEITSLDNWNVELKYLADLGIVQKAVIVATGSNASTLRRKGELFPDRGLEANEYYMRPFSFREFILQTIDPIGVTVKDSELASSLKRLKNVICQNSITIGDSFIDVSKAVERLVPFKQELDYLFNFYLRCGGYPFVVNNFLVEKQKTGRFGLDIRLPEVIMRDVIGDISRFGMQETFVRQILREIISKYGSRYSFSALASNIGINHATMINYLETLCESFIINIIYGFDLAKKQAKLKGDKKVFFQDPFVYYAVQSYLNGKIINDVINESVEDEQTLGKIVEATVSAHLALNQEIPIMKEPNTFLWFYYDNKGKEIDNIVKTNGDFVGIEVKYQKTVASEILQVPQISRSIVLTKEDLNLDEKTILVPTDIFLALLKSSPRTL